MHRQYSMKHAMIWMEFPIAANCRAHLRPRPLARSGIAGWKSKLWSAISMVVPLSLCYIFLSLQLNKIVIFWKSNAATSIKLWSFGSKILFNRQKFSPPICKRPQQCTFPICFLRYICHLWQFTSLDGCCNKYTLHWTSLYFAILLLVSLVLKILSKTILFWIIGGLSVNIKSNEE